MPRLTRWYIKSAFVYLAASLLLGMVLALPTTVPLPLFVRFMNPIFFHLFLVGWVTQMIFGVIYWMFPIITRARPRGNERVGWLTYIFIKRGSAAASDRGTSNQHTPRSLVWLVAGCFGAAAMVGGRCFRDTILAPDKDRYRGE
ncbi:MAG: cbb3-type cytochrome c oxidase subunit I [Chloroflexi bacterium]|nr:cbb3-type cytochrome c oxidase subunit I [Chloroflexota bacterium]